MCVRASVRERERGGGGGGRSERTSVVEEGCVYVSVWSVCTRTLIQDTQT